MSFVIRQRNSKDGHEYAELVTNTYVKSTHSQKQTRQFLGVIDASTGELRLSSKIQAPTQEILSLLAKARIPYFGKTAARRGRPAKLKTPGDYAYSATDFGEMHVLLQLCKEAGLTDILMNFGMVDGMALLYTAIWESCTGEPHYLAGEWLASRDYPACLADFDFTSPGMSRLMQRVGHNESARHAFFSKWIAARNYPDCVVYDTTSISTYSSELDLAEWGYNRDHEKLPQINLTVPVDFRDGMPLGYRALPGSVPDVKSLVETAHMLMEYGLSAYTNVMDKGFFSRMNIRDMLKVDGMNFIIGIPLSSKQASETLAALLPSVASSRNTVLRDDEMLHVVRGAWSQKTDNGRTEELSVYLVHNPAREQAQREELERKLDAIKCLSESQAFKDAKEAAEWIEENGKGLAKYLQADSAGRVGINHDLVDENEKKAGMALYLSRENLSAARLVECVRGRDIVEKMFDVVKNDCEQRRLRTGENAVMEGRMFLGMLSMIVRKLFALRLASIPQKSRPTAAEALAMLRRIKVINYNSRKRSYVEIPKHTRELLEAINITLPELDDLPPHLHLQHQQSDAADEVAASPKI